MLTEPKKYGYYIHNMNEINIAKLKNRLSHYVRAVREGARFVVTDHGRPVAWLVPLGDATAESPAEQLAALQAAGEVGHHCLTPHFSRVRPLRLRGHNLASRLIREDRDDRL